MQYKTIILEMLQQRPQMYKPLRRKRKLLETVELMAVDLKESHEAWLEVLSQEQPGREASQIGSEAFELALKQMEDRLPPASHQGEDETLSLDDAMAFIRNPSRRG
jgi:hypothetical protein